MINNDISFSLTAQELQQERDFFDSSKYDPKARKASEKQINFIKSLARQTLTTLPKQTDLEKMPAKVSSDVIGYLQSKKDLYGHLVPVSEKPTEKQLKFLEKLSPEESAALGIHNLESLSKKEAGKAIGQYKEGKEMKKRFSGASTWGMQGPDTPQDQMGWTTF